MTNTSDCKPVSEGGRMRGLSEMDTRKPKGNDAALPFAALQLLAPPVRLMCAALWKVLKQRDVLQYGVVEEFVTSACEAVPGLLTVRHQGKLAVGLRARLILELCSTQPDIEVIEEHLERVRVPAGPSSKKDVKLMRTVRDFHSLIHMFFTDPAIREKFFKEVFPVDYGATFEQELEKLLWEFLVRLDQLLPVPDLAQTVAWLSDSPPVLEECARAATQPQLLKILLEHEACLGHLDSAASLPQNTGDSIQASLSLPPSGRVPSDQLTAATKSSVDESNGFEPANKTSFITPVIGLISNEDVPVMNSGSKRTQRGDGLEGDTTEEHLNSKFTSVKMRQSSKKGEAKEGREELEQERGSLSRSSGVKRKKSDRESEEEEVLGLSRPVENRLSRQTQTESDQKRTEDRAETIRKEGCSREVLAARMRELGLKSLHLPEDQHLCSVFASCLSVQPRVVVEKLSEASLGANESGTGGKSPYKPQNKQRRKSPAKAPTQRRTSCRLTSGAELPGLHDKENHPVPQSASSSPSQQRSNTGVPGVPGEGDDYVADSEDEATKNFKVRLFVKRYYKTKHGTYVPTLREFWKPAMTQRHLLSAANKRR